MRAFFNYKNITGAITGSKTGGLLLVLGLILSSAAFAETLGRNGLPILGPEKATDGASNCFYDNGGLGCDNAECEAAVCGVDSFCCDTAWDSICAGEAIQYCEVDDVDNGERAVFHVTKVYTDNNTASATVTLSCYTGLPLVQSQVVSYAHDVAFVVQSYNDGELDCDVSEDPVPAGYSASYVTDSDGTADADGCHYEDLALGEDLSCTIYNEPNPVTVTVNKNWVIEGSGGDQLDPTYELTLWCATEIIGGEQCNQPSVVKLGYGDNGCYQNPNYWYLLLTPKYGASTTDDESYTADVIPAWEDGTGCWVEEDVYDDSVEVDDSDCDDWGDITVVIGGDGGKDECTIINTVFYEGIPTLSQYGIALMALLMLGLGLVGFRRFAG